MKRVKPCATFTLHIPRNHKLMVYIWPTLEAMRNRISKLPGMKVKGTKTAVGFFYGPEVKVRKTGKRNVVKNKMVGQIHLVKNRFGSEVVSHELQHFLSWWSVVKEYDLIGRDWERVPTLAGKLTGKFWRLFYEWEEQINE
jgi:hypothetical protein